MPARPPNGASSGLGLLQELPRNLSFTTRLERFTATGIKGIQKFSGSLDIENRHAPRLVKQEENESAAIGWFHPIAL